MIYESCKQRFLKKNFQYIILKPAQIYVAFNSFKVFLRSKISIFTLVQRIK